MGMRLHFKCILNGKEALKLHIKRILKISLGNQVAQMFFNMGNNLTPKLVFFFFFFPSLYGIQFHPSKLMFVYDFSLSLEEVVLSGSEDLRRKMGLLR